MFTIKCDNCGKLFEDSHQGFCAWTTESGAWENASDSGWIRDKEGVHYCPDCYFFDDDDNLVLNQTGQWTKKR